MAGRFTIGRVGRGLPLLVDAGRVPDFGVTPEGRTNGFDCRAKGLAAVGDGLFAVVLPGLSTGRDAGFEMPPFGRADPFTGDSVRGALGVVPRSSSSALRFGIPGLGLVIVVGEVAGFSPVIEASKSLICALN